MKDGKGNLKKGLTEKMAITQKHPRSDTGNSQRPITKKESFSTDRGKFKTC